MIFLDVETFGLDVERDLVIEVGIRIMNLSLTEEIASITLPIWTSRHSDRFAELLRDARKGDEGAAFVHDMHRGNNLLSYAAANGVSFFQAERKLSEFLDKHEVKASEPLCGSSVAYDRAVLKKYLPSIEKRFLHRNVDVSTLKELCQATVPTMFEHMQDDILEVVDCTKLEHRVETCLDYTIAELKWYMDNYLFIPSREDGVF